MAKAKVNQPRLPKKMNDGKLHSVGRRKEAVARVFLVKGEGKVTVNGKPADQYFAASAYIKERVEQLLKQPFHVTGTTNKYDVIANCNGGGYNGQLEAIRLGIARALLLADEAYRRALRADGLLT
ncbi:30S ribosomal protein S9, partial [Candidatus Acetothermia bacterium]|nr:30S ribosomal protein S9 [Candidatus Acetothermia bacterium]